MEQSPTLAELGKALAKAQGEIKGAIKDSQNPYFKSNYADLTSVWEACRKPLSSNGLSVIQASSDSIPETITIETTLLHSSGEWVRGKLAMKPVKSDPQSIGSCITYARRYALAAIVGICPEDDDGNDATGNNLKKFPKEDVPDFKPPEAKKEPPEKKKAQEVPEAIPRDEPGEVEPSEIRRVKSVNAPEGRKSFDIFTTAGEKFWSTGDDNLRGAKYAAQNDIEVRFQFGTKGGVTKIIPVLQKE